MAINRQNFFAAIGAATTFAMMLSAPASAENATSAAVAEPPPACDQSPLVIENVTLWSADPAPKSILILDGRIEWIGDADDEPPHARSTRRLDGRGAIALPGLIDSHTHLDALPAAKHLQRTLNVPHDIFPITMRQTLASGVTTTRVHLAAFDDMALMKAISGDDCFPSPRIVLSGPGLLAGAPSVDSRLMKGFEDAGALTRAIEHRRALGAEWIALHAPARFTDEEAKVLEKAVANSDVKFMADADSFENFAASLSLPVASAEYINRTEAEFYPEDAIATLEARNKAPFYVSPPIGYYGRSAAYVANPERALDDALFSFVPDAMAKEMDATFSDAFDGDEYVAVAIAAYKTMPGKIAQLREAGARFVVGSDTGSLGQFHHDAVWREMSAYFAFGLTPEAVIDAATSTPAEMLERPDEGRIAVGALGDIVLYTGDLEGGEFSRDQVSAVIKGGVVFVENGAWRGPDNTQTTAAIDRHLRVTEDQR